MLTLSQKRWYKKDETNHEYTLAIVDLLNVINLFSNEFGEKRNFLAKFFFYFSTKEKYFKEDK